MSQVVDFKHYKKWRKLKLFKPLLLRPMKHTHLKAKSRKKTKAYHAGRFAEVKRILKPLLDDLEIMRKNILGM